jgi:molybdopterin synthase sulfur carrier subunit
MSVSFHISGALRSFTGQREKIEIEGSPTTVGDAFDALCTRYPGLRDRVVTEEREIRQHVNVFVGRENVRHTGGLATPVSAGDEISIFPAISGG